jgi:hypothetical protein
LFVPYITKMKRAKRLQFAVKCGTKMWKYAFWWKVSQMISDAISTF